MNQILIPRRVFTILLVAGLAAFSLFAVAQATPPGRVNFQGVAQDAAGNPLNGPVAMTFRFYDAPATGALLWEEVYDAAAHPPAVNVLGGLFTLPLGDPAHRTGGDEPTVIGLFSNHAAVYLGVQMGTDAEMAPRILVSAAPFALNADALDGKQAADFANAAHLHQGTDITSAVANATNAAHATTADTAAMATNATHATTADTAASADHATTADTATNATNATNATHATSATSADTATNADTATDAGHATSADSATNATNATSAGNSDTVDGQHAADFMPASSSGTFLNTSSTPQTKAGKLTLSGATDFGIDASGPTGGVYGHSASGFGVAGLSGTDTGIYGASNGGMSVRGVWGHSTDGTGVFGDSTNNAGVQGVSNANIGVYGGSGSGTGVEGYSNGGPGVQGESSTHDGVYGRSYGGANTAGVHGVGLSAGSTAIWGEGFNNGVGGAGYFHGPVIVTGTLTKGGGAFKIDHPLDPSGKYLYHSFVESPDMMNVYNGNVVTDEAGLAEVDLPEWFETLNRDFRYQLTVMGRFAQAIVEKEIVKNQFVIRTNLGKVKVSWQVTGIRHDAWANAHRIPVEELKAPEEQGYYLHPDLYGAPEEKGIEWARNPEAMKRLKAERERVRQEPAAAPQLAHPTSQPVSPSYDNPATGASEPAGGGATIISNPALPCFAASEAVEPGDVVVMDLTQKGFVRRCTTLADPLAMGIAAGPAEGCKAGQREEERFAPARVPVASFGIASCKVDAGYGPIHEGDLLVTSPLPGHAMKAQRPIEAGTVIGKALEPLASGTGLIKVLVMFR